MTTGAAAAQYGNAQAGIVSLTSRTGGSKFAGRLAAGVRRAVRLDDRHGLQPVRGQLQRPALRERADLRGERGRRGQRVGPGGQGPRGRAGLRQRRASTPRCRTRIADGTFSDVDVNSYSIYTGDCDDVRGATQTPRIANNNGESCHGAAARRARASRRRSWPATSTSPTATARGCASAPPAARTRGGTSPTSATADTRRRVREPADRLPRAERGVHAQLDAEPDQVG